MMLAALIVCVSGACGCVGSPGCDVNMLISIGLQLLQSLLQLQVGGFQLCIPLQQSQGAGPSPTQTITAAGGCYLTVNSCAWCVFCGCFGD